jgi:hypothetical protein
MPPRALMYVFWIGPVIILAFVAALMYLRNRRRDFPVFFAYAVFQILVSCLLFASYHLSYKAYFCVYWSTSAICVVFEFLVIREIFSNLLRPYDGLRSLGAVLFRWAAAVLLMIAVISLASGSAGTMDRLMLSLLALERSVRVMECGLVLFMLLFGAHLGISSEHRVFGISLGFGVFAAVDLIVATLYALFADRVSEGLTFAKSASYMVATLIWAYYVVIPEPERVTVAAPVQTYQWNLTLAGIQDPQQNFLPMVESVVERVLSKRHVQVEHDHSADQ